MTRLPLPGRLGRHWLTDEALEILHGPDRCETCGGTGWVSVLDGVYPDELVDMRCPECVDRAQSAGPDKLALPMDAEIDGLEAAGCDERMIRRIVDQRFTQFFKRQP